METLSDSNLQEENNSNDGTVESVKAVNPDLNWYSLRVISGKEKKIRDSLLYEVDREGYGSKIDQVFVPSENIIEMRDGKKKVKNKVFFPGYLLIKMDMDKEVKYLIENLTGVMNFVGPQGNPQTLKHEEVNRILGVVEGSKDKEIVKSLFKVGDHVKVTDGPFMEFSGFVKEVNDEKQKLKVSVSIFGRPTPVELDYLQVVKE